MAEAVSEEFKTWAIVEVMGHVEYAGFISAENIAGTPMLRIDVPKVGDVPEFTKYIASNALYGISPCDKKTALARAESIRAKPFNVWGIEEAFMDKLREKGMLIEDKREDLPKHDYEYDDELPY